EVLWGKSIAIPSPKCTLNIAAFVALFHVPSEANRQQQKRIHIAGDNALLIKVLSARTPPKSTRLRIWFHKCLQLVDKVRVASWTLLPRNANASSRSLAQLATETEQT
ncbi:hypothetical protein PHYSODRAFT_404216, partial [Phytophthora sojae]